MRDLIIRGYVLLLAISISALSTPFSQRPVVAESVSTADPNPLITKWEGPYGGVPAFDRVEIALFKPALEAAMAEQLGEIDQIAKNTAAPTFENTIAAMERSGRTLSRVGTVYGVWGSTMAGPEFQSVQREMAP